DALVFVRSTPRVTSGGDRQATTVDGWVTYPLVPNGNFPKPRKGYHVQFFVKAYRLGDPALAGIAAYRLVQATLAGCRGEGRQPPGWASALADVQLVFQRFERGPARVGVALEVLVRLDVEVLAAHRA